MIEDYKFNGDKEICNCFINSLSKGIEDEDIVDWVYDNTSQRFEFITYKQKNMGYLNTQKDKSK